MARRQGVDLVPYQAPIDPEKRNQRGPSGTKAGSLLEWQGYGKVGEPRSGIEWRENVPFTATLTVVGTFRGRSAARFVWQDAEGRTFPMFLTDVLETLRRGVDVGGTVTGEWLVAKRGANYGIRLADLVLANDEQARDRTLAAPLPETVERVGAKGSKVAHLLNHKPLYEGHTEPGRYPMCFRSSASGDGWIRGEKIDRRPLCVKCTERFNQLHKENRL